MRARSVIWLVVAVFPGPLVAAAPPRVAVGLAHSGAVADGWTLGATPFAASPTVSASDASLRFAARLSGGSTPQAVFRFPAAGGEAVLELAAGMPSPFGPAYVEFFPPVACGAWSAFWTRLEDDPEIDEAIVLSGPPVPVGVARTGAAAPGGGTFDALGASPAVAADGGVVFLALVDGAPSPALFARDSGGALTRLLAVEEEAPWSPGTTLIELGAPTRACTGAVALTASVLTSQAVEQDLLLVGPPDGLVPVLAGGAAIGGTVVERLLGPAVPGPDGDWFLRALVTPTGTEAILRVTASGPEILARTGDPTPVGGVVAGLGPPCAWQPGRAAFRAALATGTGLPPGAARAALLGTGLTLAPIVVPGSLADAAARIEDLGDPSCSGDGRIAFLARTPEGERLARWQQGTITSLAASGGTAPASGRYLDGGFRGVRPLLLDDGGVAFAAQLASTDGATALVRALPGAAPAVWLAPGDAIDGSGEIQAISGSPVLHGDGIIVAATVSTPAGSPPPRTAYVRLSDGHQPATLIANGDPAPAGGIFLSLSPNPAVVDGAIVFGAATSSPAAPSGLFVRDPGGELRVLVAAGAPTGDGATLTSFSFAPVPAGDDAVAFRAVTAGGVAGIWMMGTAAGSAPAAAVIRTGDTAPGGGAVATVGEPVAGPDGSIALIAALAGGESVVLVAGIGGIRRAFGTGDPVAGAVLHGIVEIGIDATGAALASVELDGQPGAAVVREAAGVVEVLLARGDPGPETVPGGSLAEFGPLAAHADGRVALAADIAGWSHGAAVILVTPDADGDGRGDPVDCAPSDASLRAVPGEVAELAVAPASSPPPGVDPALLLAWDAPAASGGEPIRYDLLAGSLAGLRDAPFADATCAASDLPGTATVLVPGQAPGDRWFLIRARNACGHGALGAAPERAPLAALDCP